MNDGDEGDDEDTSATDPHWNNVRQEERMSKKSSVVAVAGADAAAKQQFLGMAVEVAVLVLRVLRVLPVVLVRVFLLLLLFMSFFLAILMMMMMNVHFFLEYQVSSTVSISVSLLSYSL